MTGLQILAVVLGSLVIVLIIAFGSGIRKVGESQEFVVERLGKYKVTWSAGLRVKMPLIDTVVNKVSLKEQVVDFEPQDVITKDNVGMKIDAVVFYKITEAKLYAYGMEKPLEAIRNLAMTTLRNVIGELILDETLTSRDTINEKLRSVLDNATDPWGIKVTRVEVKNILPPQTVKEAMEKQMRAERERREKILVAEGEKQSEILRAEGYKESIILKAQADAENIRLRNRAVADSVVMLNESKPSQAALALEAMKTLERVSEGQATKIVVPSDVTKITSLASIFTDISNEG